MGRIARHYLDDVARGGHETDKTPNRPSWAFGCVNDMIEADPESGWLFVKIALDECRTLDQVRYLAAGALEDLLSRHGRELIEQIEDLAQRSAKFRLLLSGCWGKNRMAPEVWKRVAAAIEEGPVIDADPRSAVPRAARCASDCEVARLLDERLP